MDASQEGIIWIYTSPDELRKLADELEEKCKKVKPADSMTVKIIPVNNNVRVKISGDQDKCRAEGYLK